MRWDRLVSEQSCSPGSGEMSVLSNDEAGIVLEHANGSST